MSAPGDVRALERRLGRAYLIAFGAVLLVFALVVHGAFAVAVDRDQAGRLAGLLAEGRAAFEVKDDRPRIDADGAQVADPRTESIAWRDRAGALLARQGFSMLGVPVRTQTESEALGTVTAGISLERDRRDLLRLDAGLAAGFVLALVVAGFGGRRLASQAIARIVATMRTLQDFTADAAHELRGPLAALQSNADASLRDPEGMTGDHRRRLRAIASTAQSMTRTVDDLLLIARAGKPLERELFAIALESRIDALVAERASVANEGGIAIAAAPGGYGRVFGNPSEIERIFGNLIDNALRFTPRGGAVTVSAAQQSGGTAIVVRDTGVGIAADDVPRVFDRFWRGDSAREFDGGSGLGLAIVRALVVRHGGTVSVESVPGRGSAFTVWLPAQPPQLSLTISRPGRSTIAEF